MTQPHDSLPAQTPHPRPVTGRLSLVVSAAQSPTMANDAVLTVSDRELSLIRAAISAAPPYRAERVAALRQRIEAGIYHVPDTLLAQRLLDFIG